MNGTSGAHGRHDRHLVAALAADDLEPIARAEADVLVAGCHHCAELLADLRAIALATAALPRVPRTRDFRISAADATHLRPTGWRALLEVLGGTRSTFLRPLAVGLTTLGLAGVLAATIPGALSGGFGSAGGAPTSERNIAAGLPSAAPAAASQAAGGALYGPQASAAASQGPVMVELGSPAPGGDRMSVQAVGTAGPEAGGIGGAQPPGTKTGRGTGSDTTGSTGFTTDQTATDGAFSANASSNGAPPLLLASVICLIAGLALFLARWGARRLARR